MSPMWERNCAAASWSPVASCGVVVGAEAPLLCVMFDTIHAMFGVVKRLTTRYGRKRANNDADHAYARSHGTETKGH